MVEESQAEDFEPGTGIRFGVVDELEGRGQFPVETVRYVAYHSGAMEDGPVPVILWNLFLGGVGSGHLDESPPGVFYDTVGSLSLGGSSNDLVLVGVYA